jgi:hypothetical protein
MVEYYNIYNKLSYNKKTYWGIIKIIKKKYNK